MAINKDFLIVNKKNLVTFKLNNALVIYCWNTLNQVYKEMIIIHFKDRGSRIVKITEIMNDYMRIDFQEKLFLQI